MIKFAVCDDESFMLNSITSQISDYMAEKKITFEIDLFTNGNELLESQKVFDILFLDIQMDRLNGMEVAKRLRKEGFQGLLIFVTILKESVFESFEVQAFDFLIKPLSDSHFRRTIERAINVLEQNSSKNIIIQKGNSYQIIPYSQILYCEVIGRKIYIHQKDKVISYYDKLENLQNHMDFRFFRCHRSYIVNLDYIYGYNSGTATLSNGEKIPVSRLREQELKKTLLIYMRERRH